jgi:hypothetical protein
MKRKSILTAGRLANAGTAILILAVHIASAQDFTVRMMDEDGKMATHYVSRNAVRNVSSNPVETDVIYRLDRGEIITLNHKHKTYTEITVAEALQQLEKKQNAITPQQQEMMRRLGINPGTLSVTKIGAGETIAGYATEKYSAKTPFSEGEIWVAPALEVPSRYYDMVTTFVAAEVGGLGQIFNELRDKQIKGFLLKSRTSSSAPLMKGITLAQVATSVDKSAIPPSIFEPPAGYEKVIRAQ